MHTLRVREGKGRGSPPCPPLVSGSRYRRIGRGQHRSPIIRVRSENAQVLVNAGIIVKTLSQAADGRVLRQVAEMAWVGIKLYDRAPVSWFFGV